MKQRASAGGGAFPLRWRYLQRRSGSGRIALTALKQAKALSKESAMAYLLGTLLGLLRCPCESSEAFPFNKKPPGRQTLFRWSGMSSLAFTKQSLPLRALGAVAPQTRANKLLAALPPEALARLVPYLEVTRMAARQVVYECEEAINYVYFPTGSTLSLLSLLEDGSAIEVGVIGREGMAGINAVLGEARSPNRVITQFPGAGLRARVEVVKDEFHRGGAFQRLLLRYTGKLLHLVCQTSACSRRHSVEERFCRWLLMLHDRVGVTDFPFTQDFIAQMLGTRRASITTVAHALQQAAAIGYTRGRISLRDRPALEARACECYRLITETAECC